jgi:hypothetical protein
MSSRAVATEVWIALDRPSQQAVAEAQFAAVSGELQLSRAAM